MGKEASVCEEVQLERMTIMLMDAMRLCPCHLNVSCKIYMTVHNMLTNLYAFKRFSLNHCCMVL